jgi:hypothetical protein
MAIVPLVGEPRVPNASDYHPFNEPSGEALVQVKSKLTLVSFHDILKINDRCV